MDTVIRLNKEKIITRLKPRQVRRRSKPDFALPWVLRPFSDDFVKKSEISEKAKACLRSLVEAAKKHLGVLEEKSRENSVEAWRAVLESIGHLSANAKEFSDRIQHSPHFSNVEEQMHQIRQLARYTGVCRTLSKLCRQYPQHFSNTGVVIVPPYRSVIGAWRSSMNLYVHAEISLLTYHELQHNKARPRVIGSSRSACYLCSSFIKAHGQYRVTSTHETFFTRWTVPDLVEFRKETRARFSQALAQVNQDILRAISTPHKRLLANIPWVNLSVVDLGRQLLSPIPSSLASRVSGRQRSQEVSEARLESTEDTSGALEDDQGHRRTSPTEMRDTLSRIEADRTGQDILPETSSSHTCRIRSQSRASGCLHGAIESLESGAEQYPPQSSDSWQCEDQADGPRYTTSLASCPSHRIKALREPFIICNQIGNFF